MNADVWGDDCSEAVRRNGAICHEEAVQDYITTRLAGGGFITHTPGVVEFKALILKTLDKTWNHGSTLLLVTILPLGTVDLLFLYSKEEWNAFFISMVTLIENFLSGLKDKL